MSRRYYYIGPGIGEPVKDIPYVNLEAAPRVPRTPDEAAALGVEGVFTDTVGGGFAYFSGRPDGVTLDELQDNLRRAEERMAAIRRGGEPLSGTIGSAGVSWPMICGRCRDTVLYGRCSCAPVPRRAVTASVLRVGPVRMWLACGRCGAELVAPAGSWSVTCGACGVLQRVPFEPVA